MEERSGDTQTLRAQKEESYGRDVYALENSFSATAVHICRAGQKDLSTGLLRTGSEGEEDNCGGSRRM